MTNSVVTKKQMKVIEPNKRSIEWYDDDLCFKLFAKTKSSQGDKLVNLINRINYLLPNCNQDQYFKYLQTASDSSLNATALIRLIDDFINLTDIRGSVGRAFWVDYDSSQPYDMNENVLNMTVNLTALLLPFTFTAANAKDERIVQTHITKRALETYQFNHMEVIEQSSNADILSKVYDGNKYHLILNMTKQPFPLRNSLKTLLFISLKYWAKHGMETDLFTYYEEIKIDK